MLLKTAHLHVYTRNIMLLNIGRVGQNRIHTPYMTVYLVISLPKIPYIHRIYIYGSGQP